jgi:hypothetical protein
MKNTIFWFVTPLASDRARRFEETSSSFSMSKNRTQKKPAKSGGKFSLLFDLEAGSNVFFRKLGFVRTI